MSVFPSRLLHSSVTVRLRAAGCVFAEDEARLLISAARTPVELDAMVARRAAGFPLEQIVGWAEFAGLRIILEPGVFVPRRRSEFLAAQAVALGRPGAVVVDLCCGAGALGGAVAAALGPVELHCADIDPAAVRCAVRNTAAAGGRAYVGDLYEALPGGLRGRVDLLIANAPYVPSEEIGFLPPEARDHEPLAALDGGADGLAVQRRVLAGARDWLAPTGHLLIETSERQAPDTAAAFTAHGLHPRVTASDDFDATVVIGTLHP